MALDKHVHGEAQLSIAFDGANGKIVFQTPAESVLGREKPPKEKAALARFEAAVKAVGNKLVDGIVFAENIKCQSQVESSKFVAEDASHGDVAVVLRVQCAQSIRKTAVKIRIGKLFERVKLIRAQLIADDLQVAKDIKQKELIWEIQ